MPGEEVLPSDLRFLDVLRAQLKDPISIKVTYYFLRRGPIHRKGALTFGVTEMVQNSFISFETSD